MSASGEPVTLHIYDLSRGMAKMLSPSLLGKQIDGIWHTAVVAFGREIFFGGGGICDCAPTATPYGPPNHVYDLGTTFVPRELFIDFLRGLSPRYTGAEYDLFENNCNTFSDELSIFLTGNHIPSHITGLPSEVLATPFGAMIKGYLNQQQQRMQQHSSTLIEDDWQALDFLPPHSTDYQTYPRPASDGAAAMTTAQTGSTPTPVPPPRARRCDVAMPDSAELLQLLAASNIDDEEHRQAVVQAVHSPELQPVPPALFALLSRLAGQLTGSEAAPSWRLLNQFAAVLVANNAVANAALAGPTDGPGFLLTAFARASDATAASSDEVLGCLRLATNLFAFPHGVVFATSPSNLPRLLSLALAQLDAGDRHDHNLAAAHLVFNLLLHGRQALDPDQVLQVVVAFAHSITEEERIAGTPEPLLFATVEVLISALAVTPDAAEVLQVTGFDVDKLRGKSARVDELLPSLAAHFL